MNKRTEDAIAFTFFAAISFLIFILKVLAADNATSGDVCIPKEQFDRFTSVVSKCDEYGRQFSKLKSENEELESHVCKIDDSQLLDCVSGMSNHEIEYLKVFIYAAEPIDVFQFAMMVDPAATGRDKARIELYSSIYLEDFKKCGFAEALCYPVFSERYQINTTVCLYKPVINEYCLNKTSMLSGIKSVGRMEGALNAGIYIGGFVIINFIGIVLYARRGCMPIR